MPLAIPTSDTVEDSAIHPGVVVLEQPLGGYTHWMAFTAYPDDVGENPNIVASNNGTDWVVPPGLINPIDPLPGDPPMVNGSRFNSDTDMVHVDGTLYAFWRFRSPELFKVWVRTSTDGVNWTPRQTVIENSQGGGADPFVSPAILYRDGTWHMWTGDNQKPQNLWRRTAPSHLGPWSPREECTLVGLEPFRHLWHFDVIEVEPDLLLGLFTTTRSGTTNQVGILYLTVSRDDGMTWQVGDALIGADRAAPGIPQKWDSNIIYRCTGVLDGSTLRTWYATDAKIGYTEIPLDRMKPALDALRY